MVSGHTGGPEFNQTTEASQVELNGEFIGDYYERVYSTYYYSSWTLDTPAIWQGLCLPLGE